MVLGNVIVSIPCLVALLCSVSRVVQHSAYPLFTVSDLAVGAIVSEHRSFSVEWYSGM